MIKAKKNKIINSVFRFYLKRLLKKHFYRIHLTGIENLSLLAKNTPTILYANHTNWWDGFAAYFLSNLTLKTDDYLMMDIEQMKKYSMFKYVGVFSVNRDKSRDAFYTIEYSAGLIKGTNRCLWIFPEGKMHVQDREPINFYSGITKIAEKTGKVNLQPVAFRYEFIGEQRPEIFISLGKGDIIDSDSISGRDLTNHLTEKLIHEVKQLKEKVINKQFGDFSVVFQGRDSRNKTVDRIRG